MISTIALRIQSDAAVHWDSYYHDTVIITYNGETKSYGGQGQGGGQAVAENQILKYYKFDNSTNDEAAAISLKNSKQLLLDYGKLEVYKEEEHVPDLLTWKDVQNTVGKEGAHIQIVRLGSSSGYGPAGIGYSYIYDDGYTYYSDSNGFYGTAVSDAWFGGRYYNDNECFEYGASFEEHSTADIYIKDPVIPVPEECVYYYGPTEDNNRSYRLLDFSTYTGYDAATGVWKGVFKFTYYSSTDTWEAEVISQACRGKNGAFVSDNTFIEAYTLTREEVLALGIDSNKDRYPDTYYTYNKLTPPGTLISVGTRYDDPDTGRSYLAGDNGEFEEILLEIKEDEVELKTKDTYELDHTISLPDSWGKAKWSSSDPSVASVDQNGKITAIRFGKATITASSENGECQDSCEVTVRFYDAVEGVVNGSNRITANISSAINWMAESEITKGYDGKYFGSFKETSRADFVIFLWRFAGKPEADETNIKTFNDIEGVYAPTSATYQAISWAASTGIINGYSDGSFKPKNSVSRGQVAIMLWKYAGQPEIVKPYTAFPDVTVNKKTGITANTVTAINWAQSEGIVKGYGSGAYKGTFQPLGSCLRFQMSIILWRYADMMQTLPKTGEKTGAGKIETDEEEIAEDIEVSEEVISLSEADEDIPISEEDSVEIEFEAAEEVETESDAESDAEEESDITIAESED